MVDFNAPQTVATPRKEILEVLVIESRKYVIDALEEYYKYQSQSSGNINPTSKAIVTARIKSLFYNISSIYKRKLKEQKWLDLKEKVFSKEIEKNIEAFEIINDWLDSIHITRIDTKDVYDKFNIEDENKVKGS